MSPASQRGALSVHERDALLQRGSGSIEGVQGAIAATYWYRLPFNVGLPRAQDRDPVF